MTGVGVGTWDVGTCSGSTCDVGRTWDVSTCSGDTCGVGDVVRDGELGNEGTDVGADDNGEGGGDEEPPSIHTGINPNQDPPLAVGSRYRAFILPQILRSIRRGNRVRRT